MLRIQTVIGTHVVAAYQLTETLSVTVTITATAFTRSTVSTIVAIMFIPGAFADVSRRRQSIVLSNVFAANQTASALVIEQAAANACNTWPAVATEIIVTRHPGTVRIGTGLELL